MLFGANIGPEIRSTHHQLPLLTDLSLRVAADLIVRQLILPSPRIPAAEITTCTPQAITRGYPISLFRKTWSEAPKREFS